MRVERVQGDLEVLASAARVCSGDRIGVGASELVGVQQAEPSMTQGVASAESLRHASPLVLIGGPEASVEGISRLALGSADQIRHRRAEAFSSEWRPPPQSMFTRA